MKRIKRILIPSIEDILNHGAKTLHMGILGRDEGHLIWQQIGTRTLLARVPGGA